MKNKLSKLVVLCLTFITLALSEGVLKAGSPEVSASELKAGSALKLTINDVPVVLRYCPAGTFMMGSPETEEGRLKTAETLHEVTLTKGYWLLETPVTQSLWKAVMGDNPSSFKGDDLPVERISWFDCCVFISSLNRGGFAPSGMKFDFPTEAEWEYACRAGTMTIYSFGNEITNLDANYDNFVGKTTPVRTYRPNAWGLYDMHGNVSEWCSDLYRHYPAHSVTDPTGSEGEIENGFQYDRVLRGGSWADACHVHLGCRSAARSTCYPSNHFSHVGFRFVLRSSSDETVNALDFAQRVEELNSKFPEHELNELSISNLSDSNLKAGSSLALTIKGVPVVFRYCPAGTHMIMKPDLKSFNSATIFQGYWLLETLVTQSLWKAVMGDNPSAFKGDDRPVERVSWDDCQSFIGELNRGGYLPDGMIFDFPTSEERDIACRAGSTNRYSFGNEASSEFANYGSNVRETTPVRKYKPNAWGLYDMHGNVREWCSDLSDDKREGRALCGGSWTTSAPYLNTMEFGDPSKKDFETGLRLALRLIKPKPSEVSEGASEFVDDLGQRFIRITHGEFQMGSALAPEEIVKRWGGKEFWYKDAPRHNAKLSYDYYMCRHTVRRSDFAKFVEETGYKTTAEVEGDSLGYVRSGGRSIGEYVNGLNWRKPGIHQTDDDPVVQVSWYDAEKYIEWLNSTRGKDLPNGYCYSLPTEAEWECACRAGTDAEFLWGSDDKKDGKGYLNAVGKTDASNEDKELFPFPSGYKATSPVCHFKPNRWGLFNMLGNVWEWCSNWYEVGTNETVTDPTGPECGSQRVFRGGSWRAGVGQCRSSYRATAGPSYRADHVGFRLALRPTEVKTSAESCSINNEDKFNQTISSNGRKINNQQTNAASLNLKAGSPLELTIKGVPVVFRYCPAGSFVMGSPESEEGRYGDETPHKVTITHGYWILETPVTNALMKAIVGKGVLFNIEDDRPTHGVSWHECKEFILELNRRGFAPAGMKFDFPTEAEWEYACRAGTTSKYNFGDEFSGDCINGEGSVGYLSPVTKYKPNAWGLYDMHGNVWEWCSDRYGSSPSHSVVDPLGATRGTYRVVRGGSYKSDSRNCRSACRRQMDPTDSGFDVGFRIVLRLVDDENSTKSHLDRNSDEPHSIIQANESNKQPATSLLDSNLQAGSSLELTIKGVHAVFRYCPPGTFMMGDLESTEGTQSHKQKRAHEVTISQGYWLLETPVTQLLRDVIDIPGFLDEFEGLDRPKVNIDWFECERFISELNRLGYAPAGMKFDFPTEAEWEYACRAGTTSKYNFGDEFSDNYVNGEGNVGKTTPVMKYKPNAWGLYDMHGNVWEWCSDWFGDYPSHPVKDPRGPDLTLNANGMDRLDLALFNNERIVVRGGSWFKSADDTDDSPFKRYRVETIDEDTCSSFSRGHARPDLGYQTVGFRLVLRPLVNDGSKSSDLERVDDERESSHE